MIDIVPVMVGVRTTYPGVDADFAFDELVCASVYD